MDKVIKKVKKSIDTKMNKLIAKDKKRDKKIKSHLKDDIRTYKKEAQEDRNLMKNIR